MHEYISLNDEFSLEFRRPLTGTKQSMQIGSNNLAHTFQRDDEPRASRSSFKRFNLLLHKCVCICWELFGTVVTVNTIDRPCPQQQWRWVSACGPPP
jgi:hypothetical protein